MFNISDYLEKFKKLTSSKDKIKQAAADSFKEGAGVSVDPTSIRISHGEIIVSVPPAEHAVVFMKREHIIAALKKRLPNIFIDRISCR